MILSIIAFRFCNLKDFDLTSFTFCVKLFTGKAIETEP